MFRSAASKVMWVGRATVFMVGLSVILAVVFGVASMASARNGDFLKLGTARNVATLPTTLVGKIVDGTKAALVVRNTGGGPAVELRNATGDPASDAERAPMTVDTRGRVVNLNSDMLDNKSSEEFADGVGGKALDASHADAADTAANAQNAAALEGKTASQFANATHPHSGADITSGTVAEARVDGTVTRDGEVMSIAKASDGAGSGLDADTVDGLESSAFMRGDVTKHEAGTAFDPTDVKSIHVSCPSGKRAVGGGALINTIPGTPIALKGDWPDTDGWTAYAQEMSPYESNWSVKAYVLCATTSP